jgi:2-polyprenyl-6-methoxyphenol hydroxylase-like FAD-dependent oxidoreductase
MGAYAEDGYYFGDVLIGDEDPEGYPALRIMRKDLQKVLLEECGKRRGLIEIKWGAVLKEIRQTEEGVSVEFGDGSSLKGRPCPDTLLAAS